MQLLIPTASDLINFDQFRTFLPLHNSPAKVSSASFLRAGSGVVRWNQTRKHLVELGTGRARAGSRSPHGWNDGGGGPRVASPAEALAQSFFIHCLLDEVRQILPPASSRELPPEAPPWGSRKDTLCLKSHQNFHAHCEEWSRYLREIFCSRARHCREAKARPASQHAGRDLDFRSKANRAEWPQAKAKKACVRQPKGAREHPARVATARDSPATRRVADARTPSAGESEAAGHQSVAVAASSSHRREG